MAESMYGSVIELQFINYIFQKNSFQVAILNDITEQHFTTYKEHFVFIRDFYNQYNQLPSKETFQGKFGDRFEWLTISDPEEYLVSKLNEAKLYRDLIVDYKKFAELIKDEKSDKAVEKMAEISQKYMKQKQGKCIDLISDAHKRFDSYMDRVNNPATSFVTTGIKELDDVFGGWDLKNESAVIAARSGVGKSWYMIKFALEAAKQGLRVGFYSGEMDVDQVGYRLDTFLGNIPNGSLTHGNSNVEDQYRNYIEEINKVVRGNIFVITPDMIGGAMTISKLRAFIEKYDLQMLFIDQLSLLHDERNARSAWEQMSNISKDLRTLQRLKKIPIICAAQLNREEYEEGVNTKNIGGSDRVGQDATLVLFIERKGDNVILTIGKARNAKTGDKLTYYWNTNMGILNYIPSENDAKKGADIDSIPQYNDTQRSNSVF